MRAKRPQRLPTVLTQNEVRRLLQEIERELLVTGLPAVWLGATFDGVPAFALEGSGF